LREIEPSKGGRPKETPDGADPSLDESESPPPTGYDVVGEIDQVGDGVSGFQVGDRVSDMTVVGSNAAYRTLRADHLTRVPAGVDTAEAATLILSWTTAYQLLHRAAIAEFKALSYNEEDIAIKGFITKEGLATMLGEDAPAPGSIDKCADAIRRSSYSG
jgi:D-arabinose 1-dehydrogenase-like Zn-dependent alcohol dehydrogenase